MITIYINNLLIFDPKDNRAFIILTKKLNNRFYFIYLKLISYFLNIKINRDFIKG